MYKTLHGLVLREVKYKESSKILTILTEEEGKITAEARGALRKGSKCSAASQVLTWSELTFFENRGRYTLTEGSVLEDFAALRADLGDYALGCYMAELLEAVSDEDSHSILMAFESAPPHKRAFYGSLPQVGLALGLMLASGVIGLLSFFLSDEAFLAWGWRVAFILSAILVGVGAYIRISVQETQDFSSAKKKTEQVKYPILAAFKHYPRTLTACVGARFVEGIAFNVFGVFSLTYLTNSCGLDKTVSLFVIVGAAAVMAVAIPFWGMRADTWGRARIFGIAAILLGITAYPTFWVLHNFSHNVLLVFLAIALPFGIIYGAAYATMSSLFSGSFEPTVRYSAVHDQRLVFIKCADLSGHFLNARLDGFFADQRFEIRNTHVKATK